MKMKMKKGISLVLCMVMAGSMFTGCKAPSETSSDPLTINVKMIDGGYGAAWIEEIKEKQH